MKNLLLLVAIFVMLAARAQTPQAINYQGIARNALGEAIINHAVSLRLTIHNLSVTGPELYKELQTATTNQFGLFTVAIGTGQQFGANSFSSINWGSGSKYLQVEFDPNGGLNFIDMGSAPLISVPYALFANIADTARYVTGTAPYWNLGNIFVPTAFDSVTALNCTTYTDTFQRTIVMVGKTSYSPLYAPNIIQVNNGEFISLDSLGGASYLSPYGFENFDPFYGSIRADAANGFTKTWPGFSWSLALNDYSLTQFNQTTGNAAYVLINDQSFGGIINTKGPSGFDNCFMSSLAGYPDNGYAGVNNSSGQIKAGMLVNSSGQGVVFADVKNFRVTHPLDKDKEIWYASIEGPEAAMYLRGTAPLINGEAHISFTQDFALMCAANGITVQLTPCSATSKGLAVIIADTLGFTVKELAGGTGSYTFNWEAKAVRKGYENYRAVRNKNETQLNQTTMPDVRPAQSPVISSGTRQQLYQHKH